VAKRLSYIEDARCLNFKHHFTKACGELEVCVNNPRETAPSPRTWSRVLLEKLTGFYPKVHYSIRKRPSPFPIPSKLDPVHIPISHFLKIHLNIILPPTPRSPKRSLSFKFPHQNPVYAPLSSSPYALHAPPTPLFSILSPEQYWVRSTDH